MHGIDQKSAVVLFHGLINKSGPPVIIVRDRNGEHLLNENGDDPGHIPWGDEDGGLPTWSKPLCDTDSLPYGKAATTPQKAQRGPIVRRAIRTSVEQLASDFDGLWGKSQDLAKPVPTASPIRRRIQT